MDMFVKIFSFNLQLIYAIIFQFKSEMKLQRKYLNVAILCKTWSQKSVDVTEDILPPSSTLMLY